MSLTWTFIWFVVNMLFVVSIITYMFMHRSYTEAKRQSNDSALIKRLNARRKLVGDFEHRAILGDVGQLYD